MSVIISNMDKPDNCQQCELKNVSGGCLVGRKQHTTYVKQFKDCPLIELPKGHGRLIDVDDIPHNVEMLGFLKQDNMHLVTIDRVKNALNSAPTVLEADESNNGSGERLFNDFMKEIDAPCKKSEK